MIASVVVTLEENGRSIGQLRDEMARLPNVAVGETTSSRRIPVTIDSPLPRALEEATNAIQQCDGVAFIDVVFVHFENDVTEHPAITPSGTERQ